MTTNQFPIAIEMKTLLQITSSIYTDAGQSTGLVKRYVAAWREANPDGKVVVRDLAKDPVPHIDAARFGAFLDRNRMNGPQNSRKSLTTPTR